MSGFYWGEGPIANPCRSPAVQSVVEDHVLRTVIRNYLGYEPTQVTTLLNWNFASDFTDEGHRRLKHHVIDYHYDVGGFNFVYANFYILNTDRDSGAHVMMKRSHNRKPTDASRFCSCKRGGCQTAVWTAERDHD
jgi:hypothetical protein